MGLLDRFRRPSTGGRDGPDPVHVAGPRTFAGLRELTARGAGTGEQREQIDRVLRDHGVPPEAAAAYVAAMVDGVALPERTVRPDLPAIPGCRLGGTPLLPAGEAWPANRDGGPLSFVAALDLGALPARATSDAPAPSPGLPAAGTMLVFWDHGFAELDAIDFVDATRVLLVPPGAAVVPAEAPDGAQSFGPVELGAAWMPFPAATGLTEADLPAGVPADELRDALRGEQHHRLLGVSDDVQGPVLDEVAYWFGQGAAATRERYSAEELAGEGWALLAQIDGTDGLEFGDDGSLYLVLPAADLAAARFDRVMGIMQCY